MRYLLDMLTTTDRPTAPARSHARASAVLFAGLAGFLHVCLTSQADPSIVDWLHSAQLLMMVILGGLGTLYGPALGALALIILIDQASELTVHWKLAVGVLVVTMTLLAPGGIVGLGRRLGVMLGRGRSRP